MATSAYSVSDITIRVQRLFGDESGVQVQQSDIFNWINDAMKEVCMQHENLLPTEANFDSVAGQQDYVLPNNCFTINNIWSQPSGSGSYYTLRPMAQAELDQVADGWQGTDYGSSTPEIFTILSDSAAVFLESTVWPTIRVFPAPDTSLTNAFKINYARYPQPVAQTSDFIELPPYYHNYVMEFCMMRAYEMDEDWTGADRKGQIIQSTIDFNNGRQAWFGRSTYPTISPRYGDD